MLLLLLLLLHWRRSRTGIWKRKRRWRPAAKLVKSDVFGESAEAEGVPAGGTING